MGQQLTLVGHVHGAGRIDGRPEMGVVAVVVIELSIGAEGHSMGAMLAHTPRRTAYHLRLLEGSVVVVVAQTVEPGSLRSLADSIEMASNE